MYICSCLLCRGLVSIHCIFDELRGKTYLDDDFDSQGYEKPGFEPEEDELEADLSLTVKQEEEKDPLDEGDDEDEEGWAPRKIKHRNGQPKKPVTEARAWYVITRYLLPLRNPTHKLARQTSVAPTDPTDKCCVVLQPMCKELLQDYEQQEDAAER